MPPQNCGRAFEAAHREWLISTDFAQSLTVLKANLADPTADSACETLLVAIIEDRAQDTQGRNDARAKQAGASPC